jgi:hypothetical protein
MSEVIQRWKDNPMKMVSGSLLAGTIGFAFAIMPLTAGCEHEISHTSETTQHPNGTVSHEDTTVTQQPNGDVVKETNKQNP